MWGPPESEPAGRSASPPLTRRSQRGRRPRVTDARGPGSASPADAHHREALRAAGLLRARREAAGRGRHPEHVLHLVRLQLQRPRPRELEEAPVFSGMEPRPAGLAGSSGDRRGPRLRDGVPPPSARTVPVRAPAPVARTSRHPRGPEGDPLSSYVESEPTLCRSDTPALLLSRSERGSGPRLAALLASAEALPATPARPPSPGEHDHDAGLLVAARHTQIRLKGQGRFPKLRRHRF